MARLRIDDLRAGYGEHDVLRGVSMAVDAGSVVSVIGPNGAGKTTTLRAVAGLLAPTAGTVLLDGEDVTGLPPHEIYARGVTLVPEDRGVFPDLTVEENLRVPVIDEPGWSREEIYDRFPELARLMGSKGRHLSGGEQQLLAIARGVRRNPRVLLLDEPGEGLAPRAVDRLVSVLDDVATDGTAVLLVEQHVELAFRTASYAYLMTDGEIALSGTPAELEADHGEVLAHLGVREP